MSSDPHAPTPAGPDPDDETEVRPAPVDPFAQGAEEAADADAAPGSVRFDPPAQDASSSSDDDAPRTFDDGDAPRALGEDEPATLDDAPATFDDAPATFDDAPATLDPEPATPDAEPATLDADPAGDQGDWLTPDSGVAAATPEPDPIVRTPSAFTPLGTPEGGSATPLEQAQALTERPEVMVGLAFVGGAVASFVLRRFGR